MVGRRSVWLSGAQYGWPVLSMAVLILPVLSMAAQYLIILSALSILSIYLVQLVDAQYGCCCGAQYGCSVSNKFLSTVGAQYACSIWLTGAQYGWPGLSMAVLILPVLSMATQYDCCCGAKYGFSVSNKFFIGTLPLSMVGRRSVWPLSI